MVTYGTHPHQRQSDRNGFNMTSITTPFDVFGNTISEFWVEFSSLEILIELIGGTTRDPYRYGQIQKTVDRTAAIHSQAIGQVPRISCLRVPDEQSAPPARSAQYQVLKHKEHKDGNIVSVQKNNGDRAICIKNPSLSTAGLHSR